MKTSAKKTKDGYFTVRVYSRNFGTEVYEYLQRWYPEYEVSCQVALMHMSVDVQP